LLGICSYMSSFQMMLAVMVLLLAGRALSIGLQDGEFGGLWNSVSAWYQPDFFYRPQIYELVRAPSAIQIPAAVSPKHTYAIAYNNTITAYDWRGREGNLTWNSEPIDGLNTTLPVLVTEPGLNAPDTVFLLTADGKLRAYSPAAGRGPLWVSNFVCSTKEGSQLQWLGANTAANTLVARCGANLAVVNLANGKRRFTIRGRTIPPTVPVPFLTNSIILSWSKATVVANSITKAGIIPWSVTLPSNDSSVTSVTVPKDRQSGTFAAVTANGTLSGTLTFISAGGKVLSTFVMRANTSQGFTNLTFLPTPAIHKGVLYGLATLTRPDPFGIAPSAYLWFPYAVNVTNPSKPKLLWQNNPEVGIPVPQAIQLSKRYMFVSLHGRIFWWYGFRRTDGMFGWSNNNFPSKFFPDDTNISIVYPTYCCESAILSMRPGSAQLPLSVAYMSYFLQQEVVPIPPLERCFCEE